MNTITISDIESHNGAMITYTENEITRMIAELKDYKNREDQLGDANVKLSKDIRTLRQQVRDFFSESEWSANELTVTKSEVNELLASINSSLLTSRYSGSFTITGTFEVEAEDEDEAASMFTDNVNIEFYSGEMDVSEIEASDIVIEE